MSRIAFFAMTDKTIDIPTQENFKLEISNFKLHRLQGTFFRCMHMPKLYALA